MGAVLGGDLVVALDPLEHRLQVFVERRGVDVRQPGLGPVGANGVRGEQRVRPVDGAAAADGAARSDADHAVCGRKEPAAQEELLIRRHFRLHEVGFVVIAACFQDDHPLAGLRERCGGHSAAAAGADHDDVRIERRLTADGDDLQCLAGVRRRVLGRARVLHAGPQWVAAIRSGKAVGEQHRQLIQRGDRAAASGEMAATLARISSRTAWG